MPPKQGLDFLHFPRDSQHQGGIVAIGGQEWVCDLGGDLEKENRHFFTASLQDPADYFRVQSTIKCSIGYLSSAGGTKQCLKLLLHPAGHTYKHER